MEWEANLTKAISVGYKQVFNGLWMATFTLPADDPKNIYCQPFNYVEIFDGNKRVDLFRIMKDTLVRSHQGFITYLCEHVITTLIDDIMFQYHQIGNIGIFTREVLEYILSFQSTRNWRLGRCDFNHQFLYKWESENLLVALADVPKPFEDWTFTYDTTSYPWTVNLVRAESELGCEIRYRKNMQGITRERDVKNLFTRIYPLGHGEGDNQLTIESVNNGIPFLQSETASIYGVKSVPWVDRRFEDAANMKATAEVMLKKFSVPFVSYSVESIDLFQRTGQDFDEFAEGKVVRVIDQQDNINIDTRIMEIQKPDVTKADITVTLANRERNVAGSIADAQRRQRIHETYAQGAETILQIPFSDNCEPNFPAIFEFFVPENMININFATARLRLEPYRAFSRAIRGGGGRTATSTSNGGVQTATANNIVVVQATTQQAVQTESTSTHNTQSPTSGASSQSTTQGGGVVTSGASSQNTTSGGGIVTSGSSNLSTTASQAETVSAWRMSASLPNAMSMSGDPSHTHSLQVVPWIPAHSHGMAHTHMGGNHTHGMAHTHTGGNHTHGMAHTHSVPIPGHSHTVTIPAHGHSVTIPAHTHQVTIPPHYHSITLPDHTHDIEFGIVQGLRAESVSIRVDGNAVPITGSLDDIDIRPFLRRDGGGRVLRNTWHRLEIVPDRQTRISGIVAIIFSSNSRGGDKI